MDMKFTLGGIQTAAKEFWKQAEGKTIFAFHGEMGSGKTTFIHALCDEKKVQEMVGSPTFSIINEYVFSEDNKEKKICHIDLYRLSDADEAVRAGVEDCLYSGNICLVEWPERAPGLFPEDTVHIYIEVMDSQTRKLQIGRN